jgi:hypothetical protein
MCACVLQTGRSASTQVVVMRVIGYWCMTTVLQHDICSLNLLVEGNCTTAHSKKYKATHNRQVVPFPPPCRTPCASLSLGVQCFLACSLLSSFCPRWETALVLVEFGHAIPYTYTHAHTHAHTHTHTHTHTYTGRPGSTPCWRRILGVSLCYCWLAPWHPTSRTSSPPVYAASPSRCQLLKSFTCWTVLSPLSSPCLR